MNYPKDLLGWVTVCAQSDIAPGAMRAVEHAGLPPIAIFNVDGHLHATSNVCTHNVAMLTDGSFSGCIVECPLHGGAFDVTTGEATAFPCEAPLRRFPVAVINGDVRVANMDVIDNAATADAQLAIAEGTTATEPRAVASGGRGNTPVVRQASATFDVRVAGSDRHFPVEAGDTLLQGALRAGIGFPYECNSGGCGSCLCEIDEGTVDSLWPGAPGLSQRARAAGRVLACQSVPQQDCVVRFRPADRYVPPISPQRRTVRLAGLDMLTADMALIRFDSDRAAAFLPGQYALLQPGGDRQVRAYSMSNLANNEGRWEFIIKRVPGGKVSPLLHALKDIDIGLALDGPYGTAFLQPHADRDVLCIAGGAGLSPMMSILRGAAANPAFGQRELHLYYGGRTAGDMCDTALISGDPLLAGRIRSTGAISDLIHPSSVGWRGAQGFVHAVVARDLGHRLQEMEIYLSGPSAMVDAVQKMLLIDYKVPSAQIHFDRFC